jgi:hypothetical protein
MANNPSEPDGIGTTGSTVPPYDGRRTTGDVDDSSKAYRDGVNVGGAGGPVEDNGPVADPQDTPGGATGSPADEQPASHTTESDLDDDRNGPAHWPGTPRAEEQS